MASGSYGQPFPASATYSTAPLALHSRQRVTHDPTLLGMGLLVGLLPSGLFALIAVPALVVGGTPSLTDPTTATPSGIALAVAGWLSSVLTIALSGGIVAAVSSEADGKPVTVGGALTLAARRWRELGAWAVLRTVLGLAGVALEKLGLGGRILETIASIGFAIATIFALPAIVVSGAMPGEAIMTSSRMVRGTFGLTMRTNLRVLTPWLLVAFLSATVAIVGLAVMARFESDVPTWSAAGAILAALGTVGFFVACGLQTAVSACVNTLIYRHGIGLPTPGVDPWSLPVRKDV